MVKDGVDDDSALKSVSDPRRSNPIQQRKHACTWVLEQTQSAVLCRVSHMTMLTIVICVMNVWNQSCQSFVASLSPFVTDLESLFTDHKMSGRPSRAKYKHIRTIWEHTFDNSPTDPNSSYLNWWSSRHGVVTLYSCWVVLFASSQHRSTYFFARPSIS